MSIERFFEGLSHFDPNAQNTFKVRLVPEEIIGNMGRLEYDPKVESDLYKMCQEFKNMIHKPRQERYAESYFDDTFGDILINNSGNFFTPEELCLFFQRSATKVTGFLVQALQVESFNNQQRGMVILATRRSLLKGLEYVEHHERPQYNRVVSEIYSELVKPIIDGEAINNLLQEYGPSIDQVVNTA